MLAMCIVTFPKSNMENVHINYNIIIIYHINL